MRAHTKLSNMSSKDAARQPRRLIGTVLALMLAAVACIGVQPAQADTEDTCTYGGALALLHSAPVAATQSDRSDRPRFGQVYDRCQFRAYRDGETFTFREDDYILGGITYFWTYEELDEFGLSRAEAIEDMQLVTQRVEMATVTDGIAGPFEPVPIIETNYRNAPLFDGHIVFNQRAFITQLPAGEYLVRWMDFYPGEPDFEATVRLLVTN